MQTIIKHDALYIYLYYTKQRYRMLKNDRNLRQSNLNASNIASPAIYTQGVLKPGKEIQKDRKKTNIIRCHLIVFDNLKRILGLIYSIAINFRKKNPRHVAKF